MARKATASALNQPSFTKRLSRPANARQNGVEKDSHTVDMPALTRLASDALGDVTDATPSSIGCPWENCKVPGTPLGLKIGVGV